MQAIELELAYKGDREYLHGTDMFNETIRVLGSTQPETLMGGCRLVIHKKARHQCRLMCAPTAAAVQRPENLIAEFVLSPGPADTIAWLVETARTVDKRRPYDEAKIMNLCRMSGPVVTLQEKSGFSAIEELVAITKLLHNSLYPPQRARWFFTRLDLERLLCADDTGRLEVSFQKNFNNRLTRSNIKAKGGSIGHIFFSMVTL